MGRAGPRRRSAAQYATGALSGTRASPPPAASNPCGAPPDRKKVGLLMSERCTKKSNFRLELITVLVIRTGCKLGFRVKIHSMAKTPAAFSRRSLLDAVSSASAGIAATALIARELKAAPPEEDRKS